MAEIRELLGNPTTIALTATATPEVQIDIIKQLGLTSDQVRLFHEGIDRPNLSLDIIKTWAMTRKSPLLEIPIWKLPVAGLFTLR